MSALTNISVLCYIYICICISLYLLPTPTTGIAVHSQPPAAVLATKDSASAGDPSVDTSSAIQTNDATATPEVPFGAQSTGTALKIEDTSAEGEDNVENNDSQQQAQDGSPGTESSADASGTAGVETNTDGSVDTKSASENGGDEKPIGPMNNTGEEGGQEDQGADGDANGGAVGYVNS